MATDLINWYCAYLRSESRADRTIGEYRKTLVRAHRDLPEGLDQACEDELKNWLWRDGLAPASREVYWCAITGFFQWAVGAEALDFNPAAYISRPKVPKRLPNPVTDEQVTEALARASEPYLTWIKLASYGGLRCVDIAHQRREHITAASLLIVRSKGGKQRTLPTHPLIWEAVRHLPPGPIADLTPKIISSRAVWHLQRTLKMDGVHLHRFRHWFGTQVQRRYKNLLVTQQALGHENPSSTAGYALVAGEEIRAAIDLLPNLAGGAGADSPEVLDQAARPSPAPSEEDAHAEGAPDGRTRWPAAAEPESTRRRRPTS